MRVRITAILASSACSNRYPGIIGQICEFEPTPRRDSGMVGYVSGFVHHPLITAYRQAQGWVNEPTQEREWCLGLQYEPVGPEEITSQPPGEPAVHTWIKLTPTGASRIQETPLSNAQVAAAIKATAQEQSLTINNAFRIDGQPVRIIVGQNGQITAGVLIKSLRINTHYLQLNGALVPVFTRSETSVPMILDWPTPEGMKLYVSVNMGWEADTKLYIAQHEGTLLFAKGPNGQPVGFFRLPLPNIYTDGRVCMGGDFVNQAPTIEEVLKKALNHLYEAPWNTDLMPSDQTNTKNLFRFDPSTTKALPPAGDWWHSCIRVSRVEMDQLTQE